jgi:hypothetical protein
MSGLLREVTASPAYLLLFKPDEKPCHRPLRKLPTRLDHRYIR